MLGARIGGTIGRWTACCGGFCAVQGWRGRLRSPIATTGTASATVTIAAPPEVVARFCRDPQQLALALPQIERLDLIDGGRSHWVVRLPGGLSLRWQAVATSHQGSDHRISWQTEGACSIEHEGDVVFEPAPGGRGTEVHAYLRWRDPTAGLGDRLARYIGGIAGHAPRDELRRGLQAIKQMIEAGETPTAETNPQVWCTYAPELAAPNP